MSLPMSSLQPLSTFTNLDGAFADADRPKIIETVIRFDSISAPIMEQTVAMLVDGGVRRIVIDAERTTFMTGAGLRALLAMAITLQQAGGSFAVCNLKGQPKKMFDAVGYENIIALFDDRRAALDAIAA